MVGTTGAVTKRRLIDVILMATIAMSVFYVGESNKTIGKNGLTGHQRSRVNSHCNAMIWFDKRQRTLCTHHPDTIARIRDGIEKALTECRRQFRSYRWNCSPLTWTQVFSERETLLKKRSRESAFVQALSAAGMMLEIAQACAEGDIKSCGCDTSIVAAKKRRNNNKKWTWGHCGDNFRHGSSFTKRFMDPRKITNHAKKTKSHNHEVGRKIVRDNVIRKCKCHGNSKSCTMKICWKVVPSIEKVGDKLWDLYQNSVKSRWDQKEKKLYEKTKSKQKTKVEITKDQLTFFSKSEDFCQQNIPMGVMGTYGRTCNQTSNGQSGCSTMCCGRKFKTTLVTTKGKCNCRFVWCCRIECDPCEKKEKVDTCL